MVEWYWQRKTKELGEKAIPVPTCPPQLPHALYEGLNLFFHTVKPVPSCLSSGLGISAIYTNYSLHTYHYSLWYYKKIPVQVDILHHIRYPKECYGIVMGVCTSKLNHSHVQLSCSGMSGAIPLLPCTSSRCKKQQLHLCIYLYLYLYLTRV
jgi:hypothetical protein